MRPLSLNLRIKSRTYLNFYLDISIIKQKQSQLCELFTSIDAAAWETLLGQFHACDLLPVADENTAAAEDRVVPSLSVNHLDFSKLGMGIRAGFD